MSFNPNTTLITFIVALLISTISWSQQPPVLSATGNEAYCPLSEIPIVTDFNISNPDKVEINHVYIQISEGYATGEDSLLLTGVHLNITPKTFDPTEGKLELEWTGSGPPNDSELITAVKNIVFKNTSATPFGEREFSITIGEANYLPSTGHYYEYIEGPGITWSNAKIEAESKDYYGLKGYLATLTSPEESQLCGEQAIGTGWIGGTDENIEGDWMWVTGPEGLENGGLGRQFWKGIGNGITTAPDNYANWNTIGNEPNDCCSNNPHEEDYAHIVSPTLVDKGDAIRGSWNDLPNTGGDIEDYEAKGYIIEYGWPGDAPLDFTTSTTIFVPTINTTTSPTAICGSGIATIEATANTGNVIWFDAPTGGNNLGNGDNFTTPNISTTTSYYALASADGICETGLRTKIDAVVHTIPTIESITDDLICGAETGTVTAVASAGIINWYDMEIGGNLVGTGSSFTSPVITATTTYYADATENSCTTLTRTPATINVQYTLPPTAPSTQNFCDIENATLSDLTITGTNIIWYTNAIGGTTLPTTTLLANNIIYYATQTVNTCESPTRTPVIVSVFETVIAPINIPVIEACDSTLSGSDTDGFTQFDITTNNTILLNGKDPADYTFNYYTDPTYTVISEITNPTNFENTVINRQTIYVRISNNLDNSCYTDSSFVIIVNTLPVIQATVTLKNCDEDGTPDGFTDFNLTEADPFITNEDTSLTVTYYLTLPDAESGNSAIAPSPFNNATANTVYARVENLNGCYRIATISLEVSTTSFPIGYMNNLEQCDADDSIDGFETFDLTLASADIINQFPTGQNLSVHYFRSLTDAQLTKNEILPQDNYVNETPFLQTIFVRVQSEDNGDCFGVGEHVTLTVYPRPEFDVNPTEIVCLNLPPITLAPSKTQGTYTYEWYNETGTLISSQPMASVSEGGIYTAIATSGSGCVSFPKTVTVSESVVATITINDITITDDSENNTITINTSNLGIGDYEFALDNSFGPYQDEPIFEMVAPGIHTIFVQDKNNCGIVSIEVSVIGFPKFFTPNNDGFNDTWQILGVNDSFYPTSLIYIFDRFGKLITQISPTSEGWNGISNGKQLPSSDYWFTAQLIDSNGNIRDKKGHFSLIR